jgi:hypothetical protein
MEWECSTPLSRFQAEPGSENCGAANAGKSSGGSAPPLQARSKCLRVRAIQMLQNHHTNAHGVVLLMKVTSTKEGEPCLLLLALRK